MLFSCWQNTSIYKTKQQMGFYSLQYISFQHPIDINFKKGKIEWLLIWKGNNYWLSDLELHHWLLEIF